VSEFGFTCSKEFKRMTGTRTPLIQSVYSKMSQAPTVALLRCKPGTKEGS
jgi:hypothetical protein